MSPYMAQAGAVALYVGMTFMFAKLLALSPVDSYIFYAVMSILGLLGMGLWVYFRSKWKSRDGASGGAAASGEGGTDDASIDQIVREADARLAGRNVTIANLPLVFVVGDRGSTKTSAMVYSGIEPELLAGAAFGEGQMTMPTQHANVWFARETAFVEAAGSVFADPRKWLALVKRLKPASLKSLVGKGQQAPRGVLLCFDIEMFAKPGAADAVAAAARYIQARFAEISQVLGINFPVYVLFTRTDRIQYFTDYFRNLSNEEASQVFGATLPIRQNSTGIYAESEGRLLNETFTTLIHSLCDKRTVLLPREGDPSKTPLPYEFPRELAKLRNEIIKFLVEVCRPSQLRASPFLRGFYFAGVRPVVIGDSAGISLKPESQEDLLRGAGAATQMFRMGKIQEEQQKLAQAKAQAAGRRVPQWMFLGHLFSDVLLRDTSALGASGSSTKTSFLQRMLLASAAGLLLLYSLGLLVSFLRNRSLENQAITAASELQASDLKTCEVPPLEKVQKLETLRQSLLELTKYHDDGPPLLHRLGLYAGDDMLPEVRKAYYDRFRALLFGRTQKGLIAFMGSRGEPDPERDNFLDAYDTVKSYLLTAEEYKRATSDKSLAEFLGTTLHQRWANCNQGVPPPKDVADLAEKQFKFYAGDLVHGNPYPGSNDRSVETGRLYLSKFGGIRTAYAALLGETNKKKPAITYNQRFVGTDYAVVDRVPVAYAFTKDGFAYMAKLIKENKFTGEEWVLGSKYSSANRPGEDLAQGIRDAYNKDYIETWRKVVKEARFQGYAGLPDAKDKLTQIISAPQPVVCVFWWTAQNTNIDLGSVKQAFASVHAVAPPTDAEPCVTQKNESYNGALRDLQQAISRAVQPGANPIDAASSINVQKDSAKATVSSLAQGAVDPEARLNESVKSLLLAPILSVQGPDPTRGPNEAGASFCAGFNDIIKSKFPFKQVTPEVTLAELAEVFKPKSGRLYQFYESTAKKFIMCSASGCEPLADAALPPNPGFVSAMSALMRFSTALYGDGSRSEPSFSYVLRPKSKAYDRFNISVNGDKALVPAGGQSKTYTWPGGSSQSFSVEVILPGNSSGDTIPSPSTLWSVFRFFASADEDDGVNYTFNRRSGTNNAIGAAPNGEKTIFQFSVDGAPVSFSKGRLNGLSCVGRITK